MYQIRHLRHKLGFVTWDYMFGILSYQQNGVLLMPRDCKYTNQHTVWFRGRLWHQRIITDTDRWRHLSIYFLSRNTTNQWFRNIAETQDWLNFHNIYITTFCSTTTRPNTHPPIHQELNIFTYLYTYVFR